MTRRPRRAGRRDERPRPDSPVRAAWARKPPALEKGVVRWHVKLRLRGPTSRGDCRKGLMVGPTPFNVAQGTPNEGKLEVHERRFPTQSGVLRQPRPLIGVDPRTRGDRSPRLCARRSARARPRPPQARRSDRPHWRTTPCSPQRRVASARPVEAAHVAGRVLTPQEHRGRLGGSWARLGQAGRGLRTGAELPRREPGAKGRTAEAQPSGSRHLLPARAEPRDGRVVDVVAPGNGREALAGVTARPRFPLLARRELVAPAHAHAVGAGAPGPRPSLCGSARARTRPARRAP